MTTPRRPKLRPPETVEITSLKPDPKNRRAHNARNIAVLRETIMKVGAARSIVIDEHNEILAGNGVVEAAGDAGISKVRIIDADGHTLIAVRRSGLTANEKYALSIADNRAAELAAWNPDLLRADRDAGMDLKPYFTDEELKKILRDRGEPQVKEVATGDIRDRFWIAIRGPLKHQAVALQRLRDATKDLGEVDVELGTQLLEPWQP